MKKYTFKHKGNMLFVTNAESDEEALQFAKDEKAFEEIDNAKLGFYDNMPAIVVIVEDIEEDKENED
jgi:hypothetical protein